MRGWIDIGCDVNWEDYGGRWAKRAKDGSYYVIEFTNMYDACGEIDCKRDGQDQYVCEVSRVDLKDLDASTIKSALNYVGLDLIDVMLDYHEVATVGACASYGAKQPLESFSGNVRPANVRADARRAAEGLMKDAIALETKLNAPVNKIGSTAREYARGEIMPALTRLPEGNTAKSIMTKMIGLPTLGGGIFGEK
jgi:hypothetical protein